MDAATAIRLCSLAFWGYAAYSDYTTQRAPNWVWAGVASLGVLAFAAVPPTGADLAGAVGGALALYPGAAYLYARGDLGGADVKALAVIPLAYPSSVLAILAASAVAVVPAARALGTDPLPALVPLAAGVAAGVCADAALALGT